VRAALAKRSSHSYTAFQEVSIDYALFDGLFEHTAEGKKRDPPSQAFLVEALPACYAGKNFLQTLYGLCGHAVACDLPEPCA
jgi:hypothetical protein